MARSLIQSKKQDNRKSSGVGGWSRQRRKGEEGCTNFKKGGGDNIGGLYKVGWVRTPQSTMLSKDKILRSLWRNSCLSKH